MLLILLAAAVVSGITNFVAGENFAEAAIILVVVLLNAILGVVQESKAEAAIEALQTMTAATCKVMRDGHQTTLHSEELVPGMWWYWKRGTASRRTDACWRVPASRSRRPP